MSWRACSLMKPEARLWTRFAKRDPADPAIGLAGTLRRCDNLSPMEPSHSGSGVATREPAKRSTEE